MTIAASIREQLGILDSLPAGLPAEGMAGRLTPNNGVRNDRFFYFEEGAEGNN
jgi:hypothetical protein